jgi:hypothetical protein
MAASKVSKLVLMLSVSVSQTVDMPSLFSLSIIGMSSSRT